MYPTQNYQFYPTPMQYANPYAMPQVNAVKIDINNPQAYGGANSHGQINPIAPAPIPQSFGPYNYPYTPMYAMPTVPQYVTPGAYPPPMLNMPQMQMPVVPVPPVPVATTVPVAPKPVITATPAPVAPVASVPAPVVNNTVTNTVAPTPVSPTPIIPAPVPVTSQAPKTVPAAVVDNKANTTVAPVAPVTTQAPAQPSMDISALVAGLSSKNADDQTAAIQKIAEVAQTEPAAAKALLNEQVFGQLVNVINADTSKLKGPTGKPDPKNLSPLEKAEINKQFAVYTLAILQKNFREEINKEMKKNNLPDIAINDLPYIKEGIVNNLKDNPNPTIREACLSALKYVGRPEDKQVLRILYDVSAKHDASPAVKAAAKDYLSKLPA